MSRIRFLFCSQRKHVSTFNSAECLVNASVRCSGSFCVGERDRTHSSTDVLTLVVGAHKFQVRRTILAQLPDTRLGRIARLVASLWSRSDADAGHCSNGHTHPVGGDSNLTPNKDTVLEPAGRAQEEQLLLQEISELCDYFDESRRRCVFCRHSESFSTILDYYRTGELHLARDVCFREIQRDLIYWGIDPVRLL